MARQFYSRRHYDRVSPPADPPSAVAERSRYAAAAAQAVAVAEREARWPTLTPENAAEAIRWQTARIQSLLSEVPRG